MDFKKPLYELDIAIDSDRNHEPFIVDYDAFVAGNEFDQTTRAKIACMNIGDEMYFGGGASPLSKLRRIA